MSSISITKYIDITSGVGGASAVGIREFMLRMQTESVQVPFGKIATFTSSDTVGLIFGDQSPEHLASLSYLGYVSKRATSPDKISFGRYNPNSIAPYIIGARDHEALAGIKLVTAGSFTLSMGGESLGITAVDFSGAITLAACAVIMETAIQTGTGTLFTAATCTYDAGQGAFLMTGGEAGAAAILIETPGSDIAVALGWTNSATVSDGGDGQTPAASIAASASASDNFGSFDFITDLDVVEAEAVAVWNRGQNNKFINCQSVTAADYVAMTAALTEWGGTAITLDPIADQFPELLPACVLASTDFQGNNAVANYMFQNMAGADASVLNDIDAATYSAARVNYFGQTQSGPSTVKFYQDGFMTGSATTGDATDMGVYANEIWLKAALTADLMSFMLAVNGISANVRGAGQVLGIMQPVLNQAGTNGTFAPGKPLTATQKAYIANVTGDDLAWHTVYNVGYWVDVKMVSYQEDQVEKWKAKYILIYSKNDTIRKVEGSDILI